MSTSVVIKIRGVIEIVVEEINDIKGRRFVQVAQLSQRDHATHELLRFAKL